MHFAKTYTQLLITLPPELRNNVFEYRKLKRLINQTVSELDSLGLGPLVLQSLHRYSNPNDGIAHLEEQDFSLNPKSVLDGSSRYTIVYEITSNSSVLEPRLRLSSGQSPSDVGHTHPKTQPIYHVDLPVPEQVFSRVVRPLLHPPVMLEDELPLLDDSDPFPDLIIPLPSNTAFFQLLASTLSSLSDHLNTVHDNFRSTLTLLATAISSAARPASSSAPRSFATYSPTANNAISLRPSPGGRSDLYTWRKIFRLYTEAEVLESISQSIQVKRSVEGAEERLKLFEELIRKEKASLIFSGSRECLDIFIDLNLFILCVKKFELANSEATRKILKKHAKRTTFPIPSYLLDRDASASTPSSSQVVPITRSSESLPRLLVQAIGEVLLPIVPHIDDYLCLICTSVAFKPIRLHCSHFFCVRCLVKMQKRGMANCPLCRAPTVLQANPSNVDYGLLNFMADWFPIESREKMRANEQEVAREQLEEFGISGVRICLIM